MKIITDLLWKKRLQALAQKKKDTPRKPRKYSGYEYFKLKRLEEGHHITQIKEQWDKLAKMQQKFWKVEATKEY